MRRTFSYLVLAIVAALAFGACGNNTSSSNTTSGSGTFNDADVTFAASMIPHHEQAVEMAAMAQRHASSSQVKQLAAKIEGAQGREIKTMSAWLKDWGKKVPSDSMCGMSGMNNSGRDTPGMMSDADMEKLDAARGSAFDQMFLTMMISHHSGAIEMARTEQTDGKNSEALALAKKIEAAQTVEIADMRKMLKA